MPDHLLNLRVLANEETSEYSLLSFQGREAISEPFDYRIELVTTSDSDLTQWIGKPAEFDVARGDGSVRVFAGRIYGARRVVTGDGPRIFVQIRPAYFALSYGRGIHFFQDKTSVEILNALTDGVVKTLNATGTMPKRGYSVRYDETEMNYLDRVMAQDGIFYFFRYDRSAGAYRDRMIVGDTSQSYVEVDAKEVEFVPNGVDNVISSLEHSYRAAPRKGVRVSFDVNKLDTPFRAEEEAPVKWGAVHPSGFETIGFEAGAGSDNVSRQKFATDNHGQSADIIQGSSGEPSFQAGGRVKVTGADKLSLTNIVFTSVTHSAVDPWMLPGARQGSYTNQFTAMDAANAFRPPIDQPERKVPGPILGVVSMDGAAKGEIKVDEQGRVPVIIANRRDYSDKGMAKHVWIPVKQQWAHSTHGAQFFPRVDTRVVVDFLYGNPDLPFVSGTVYTPSHKYPFEVPGKATQSGWRSVTEKNGGIVQEFHFEDKQGSEQIYLHTGRDYRREIDQDEWGTIKRDQTVEIGKDQKLTVKGDRTADITGKQTITVTSKGLLESKQELEFKVGECSIKMTLTGIEIKAPQITIKASATLAASADGMASFKSPKTDVNGDGMLTLKGGIVMIN